MAKYKVTYERDENGWWIAHVLGVSGVNSDGRTIADARHRVREALSLAVGDAEAARAELVDDVKLPAEVRKTVRKAKAARTALEALQESTQGMLIAAVTTLRGLGLSVRDIAEMVGVSHQRVQQLTKRS